MGFHVPLQGISAWLAWSERLAAPTLMHTASRSLDCASAVLRTAEAPLWKTVLASFGLHKNPNGFRFPLASQTTCNRKPETRNWKLPLCALSSNESVELRSR